MAVFSKGITLSYKAVGGNAFTALTNLQEVAELGGDYTWLTAEQIRQDAALPTAFRQFWEEIDHV